jgi:hypothetical protein
MAAEIAVASNPLGQVLDNLDAVLADFIAFPSAEARTALTLWIAHTHCYSYFDVSPRLAVMSPMKQSGKTRTLEMIEFFAPHAVRGLNVTPAGLVTAINDEAPLTLLVDEMDTEFGHYARQEQLRAVINGGYRKGAYVIHKRERFQTFAPLALAGIGTLPDTILDRSIVIHMRRRRNDQTVRPLRPREIRDDAKRLRLLLSAHVNFVASKLSVAQPALPAGLSDRAAEIWEPIVALADEAGGGWPERARVACAALTRQATGTVDPHIELLRDISAVISTCDGFSRRLESTALVRELKSMSDFWNEYGASGGLTTKTLSTLLDTWGLKPSSRTASTRGYSRVEVDKVLAAYL